MAEEDEKKCQDYNLLQCKENNNHMVWIQKQLVKKRLNLERAKRGDAQDSQRQAQGKLTAWERFNDAMMTFEAQVSPELSNDPFCLHISMFNTELISTVVCFFCLMLYTVIFICWCSLAFRWITTVCVCM